MKMASMLLFLVTTVAAHGVMAQGTTKPQDLLVVKGEMPLYPVLAKTARVSGSVQLQVTVKDGDVVATQAISGNPLLASPTIANVKTWKFYKTDSGTFTTTFTYLLEREESPGASNPRKIELELPTSVKITAKPPKIPCQDCDGEHKHAPQAGRAEDEVNGDRPI